MLLAISVIFALNVSSAVASTDVLVVDERDLSAYWIRVEDGRNNRPRFPPTALRKELSACVNLGMVIEPDGSTSRHRPLEVIIAGGTRSEARAFVESAIEAAKRQRFEPGPQNQQRQATFTAWKAVFRTGEIESPETFAQSCEIPSLMARLQASHVVSGETSEE